MTILVIIRSLAMGGAERVVSRLTTEWATSHRVTIALFDATQTAYSFGGRVVDLRLPGQRNPVMKLCAFWNRSIRIARLIKEEQPDRVVSFMESANFPAIGAAALTGILDRLLVSVRNNPTAMSLAHRLIVPLVYRLPAQVVVPSDGLRRRLIRMGIPRTKLRCIPNPTVYSNRVLVDAPLSVPYILSSGQLHRKKGFDRLLTAFAKLNEPGVDLVILGSGAERERLIALATELDIGSTTHFPGSVSDIELWYQHARCFVLASRYEGWPNVLMEAMAQGCPVISFNCRYGPEEILEDGKSGLLVVQDDIEGLTRAIERVLADRALSRRLARNGRERGKMFAVGPISQRWLTAGTDRSKSQSNWRFRSTPTGRKPES